jgi:hypothetical protein
MICYFKPKTGNEKEHIRAASSKMVNAENAPLSTLKATKVHEHGKQTVFEIESDLVDLGA